MTTRTWKYCIKKYNDHNPVITDAEWGQIIVSYRGNKYSYRDVIIWPNGSVEWDWRNTDTHHHPGIKIADVKKLVNNGVRHVILSTGFENILEVDPNTIAWLHKNKINYSILNSADAIITYNTLKNDSVGILLHSTC